MGTFPLDLPGVLGAASEGAPDEGMPDRTVMGHVHLQVRDVAEAEAFYSGGLGFDVTVRGYPGALFVSAGGLDLVDPSGNRALVAAAPD